MGENEIQGIQDVVCMEWMDDITGRKWMEVLVVSRPPGAAMDIDE